MADEPENGEEIEEPVVEEEAVEPDQEPEAVEDGTPEDQTSEGDGAPEAEGTDQTDQGSDETPDSDAPEPKAGASAKGEEKAAKAKDLPPGADLEPISLEPEVELDAEEKARQEAEAEEKAAKEAELTRDEVVEEEPVAAVSSATLPKDARIQATGKRKRSVARVVILPGKGTITVNGREFEEYFPRARHRTIVSSPLVATGFDGKVEVRVLVQGGGISGQAGAARHGIARGLTEAVPELRQELKKRGFLTRDSRAKERRKAGLKKARKRPQFSKR